jgi:hypothetical protein
MHKATSFVKNLRSEKKIGAVRHSIDWFVLDSDPVEIWFEVEATEEILDRIQLRPEPFLIALLVPCMERGVDLFIDAPIENEQLVKTNDYVCPLLASILVGRRMVHVSASSVVERQSVERQSGSLTGMSCGVDSFFTLNRSLAPDFPVDMRVKYLAFHDVGASGQGGRDGSIFKDRFSRAEKVANQFDLPIIRVLSNLAEVYQTGFVQTHTLRNAAAAAVLQDIAGSYLYSSTFGYSGIHGGATWDSATADPIILPNLSTRNFEMISSGAGLSRLDKTLTYMESPFCLDSLDICTSPNSGQFQNCGKCGKCGRFLLLAEARGELVTYASVFDLERYWSRRWRIVVRMTQWAYQKKYNANDRDHLQHVMGLGLPLPWTARVTGRIVAALSYVA